MDRPDPLARHRLVGIDTVVWTYALEQQGEFGPRALALLAAVEAGQLEGVVSTLVLAELLVGPYRAGGAAVADRYAERLATFPHLRVVAPDAAVCRLAARLRADAPALRLPDAIHLATSLAADHGDSLGEEGRWGHAYTLYPEIVRVPLIVHLPERLRARYVWDGQAPAFLTDLTPSLYALLGHQPAVREPMFGRPLFATDKSGLGDRSGDYLVASSYGPVYGVLRERGRSLYVVDAINFRDYLFDLTVDLARASQSVSPAVRAEDRRLIREQIEEVARYYRFSP